MTKSGDFFKLTVLGDVMSEPIVLEHAKRENGYDYSFLFEKSKDFLGLSDYVIANLETPLAGEEAEYSKTIFSFNAPDSLLYALKDAGVKLVTTANNHALDRGVKGLKRTLQVLDNAGVLHTGTYLSEERKNETAYFKAGDTTVAVISYTYGVNGTENGEYTDDELKAINFLRPGGHPAFISSRPLQFENAVKFFKDVFDKELTWEQGIMLKRALNIPVAYKDNNHDKAVCKPYFEQLKKDYTSARQNADIVLFFPHIGGQFNTEPGEFSNYVIDTALEIGFDGILPAHSHTTQKAEIKGETPVFYSLGNVSMSSNTFYSVHEALPQYGIAAHLYIGGGKIQKTAFSIFKIVEDEDKPMNIVFTDKLYGELDGEEKKKLKLETDEIYKRITGKDTAPDTVLAEYSL